MPHASEIPCNDELKVYRVEGVGEEEERSSAENLKDVKTSLVTEEEEKNATNFSSSTKSPRPAEQSGPASQHGKRKSKEIEVKEGKPFEHQHFLPPTPYGYMVAPIPHPNGPYGAISMVNRVPLVSANHTPFPFMPYPAETFHQPPPAHMGISHLNHRTGIGRPPLYPMGAPNQFHPSVFSTDIQPLPWPHNTMYSMAPGFRPPTYTTMALTHPNLQGRFSPHPGMLTGIPTSIAHPQLMGSGPKMETPDPQDNRQYTSYHSPHPPSAHPLLQTQNTGNHVESTTRSRSEQKKSHIKKPLNAFMLFMKEQRPSVMQECTLKESAAINQILGKRWHSLTREEQGVYYEKAREERHNHMIKYPGWTARDNYAHNSKKKKRKRDKSQDGDGNSPKKCRARYGLDQQSKWCRPCRRKKKCSRFQNGSNNSLVEGDDNIGSVETIGSLEAQTPDSRYSVETSDSGNHESSEFSQSSPGPFQLTSSPNTVPRPVERVQSINGDSHPLNVQQLSSDQPVMEDGDVTHVGLPTPPSTDSSTAATVST